MTDHKKFIEQLKGVKHIVINDCYGGFGLSDRARREYCKSIGIRELDFNEHTISRDDPYLIKVVKELGMGANGQFSNLKIIEIPGNVEWIVSEHDGAEWVAEKHRTWS